MDTSCLGARRKHDEVLETSSVDEKRLKVDGLTKIGIPPSTQLGVSPQLEEGGVLCSVGASCLPTSNALFTEMKRNEDTLLSPLPSPIEGAQGDVEGSTVVSYGSVTDLHQEKLGNNLREAAAKVSDIPSPANINGGGGAPASSCVAPSPTSDGMNDLHQAKATDTVSIPSVCEDEGAGGKPATPCLSAVPLLGRMLNLRSVKAKRRSTVAVTGAMGTSSALGNGGQGKSAVRNAVGMPSGRVLDLRQVKAVLPKPMTSTMKTVTEPVVSVTGNQGIAGPSTSGVSDRPPKIDIPAATRMINFKLAPNKSRHWQREAAKRLAKAQIRGIALEHDLKVRFLDEEENDPASGSAGKLEKDEISYNTSDSDPLVDNSSNSPGSADSPGINTPITTAALRAARSSRMNSVGASPLLEAPLTTAALRTARRENMSSGGLFDSPRTLIGAALRATIATPSSAKVATGTNVLEANTVISHTSVIETELEESRTRTPNNDQEDIAATAVPEVVLDSSGLNQTSGKVCLLEKEKVCTLTLERPGTEDDAGTAKSDLQAATEESKRTDAEKDMTASPPATLVDSIAVGTKMMRTNSAPKTDKGTTAPVPDSGTKRLTSKRPAKVIGRIPAGIRPLASKPKLGDSSAPQLRARVSGGSAGTASGGIFARALAGLRNPTKRKKGE